MNQGGPVVERESVYEYVGGAEAFVTLAAALTERCLADPVLNHPFSHGTDPQHNERLGAYLGEVFGGPPTYTQLGGHSAMLAMHAGTGADADFGSRFVACFDLAVEDAGFPDDADLRRVLHDYMVYATNEVDDVSPQGMTAEPGLAMPRWSWNGRIDEIDG
jgi:hemoglobin